VGQGVRNPQIQGKVERFHGELQWARQLRAGVAKPTQAWLDHYRWEHNHLRPHEALGMATPTAATCTDFPLPQPFCAAQSSNLR
jgi:transposase InsO family protein